MIKNFLLIGILLISFLTKAQTSNKDVQDSNKEESISQKKLAVQTLNQKFAVPVLNAYQENSKSKVEDLFSYFQLLTDASLPVDLKKEVVKNINLLVQNPNTIVVDFTSESLDKITIQQLIQKLLISDPIIFSVSEETKFNSVDYNSWKTSYTVSKTKSGLVTKTKIIQKIYFYETSKSFGNETKIVFSTILGEM
ncbi:MAG: hypothetical protein H7239_14430 [Flavobacterium sp.]|nr:hypothetical protein [Flavobacterium sp.]